ncbi:MAG: hypothetical protein QOD63_2848, partial [Actinomycetota bacterium]|nr:hypothetical protein [Actinomycetota bacterium]
MNGDTPEDEVAQLVEAVLRGQGDRDSLVALLPERVALYTGRS